MNYNRQRNRQQIINKLIQQAEQQKLESVQSGLNDPFQVYYYPTPLEDPQQIQKLQRHIRQKLIQQANMTKMAEMEEEMGRQLYLINEQIKAEELEQQYLDLMIKQLEGQIKASEIKKQTHKEKHKIQSNSISCQTTQTKLKQVGTDYQQIYTDASLTKQNYRRLKQLNKVPAFSINIYSQGLQPKQTDDQKIKLNNKVESEQNSKTIKLKSKQIATRFQQASALNIRQLNSDLQKEMKYLSHLKNSDRKREYRDQKRKVKFLMELFWKHAQGEQKWEQNDMSLPLIEI